MKKEGVGKRIGLFGGTFNPVHLGHLRGAEDLREAFGLHKVIFIPAAHPPHKAAEKVVDPGHRFEMVRLATAGNPHFSTSDIELRRPGRSYSIDTVRHFLDRQEGTLFFILGSDAFEDIETWKEFRQLFSLCHFIVMTHPESGQPLPADRLPVSLLQDFRYSPQNREWTHVSGHTLFFNEISYLDISSTKIRDLIQKGKSIRYLVSPEVEAYIKTHGLYRKH
jgi:nicotinate-nucleotide adenylyltransferase